MGSRCEYAAQSYHLWWLQSVEPFSSNITPSPLPSVKIASSNASYVLASLLRSMPYQHKFANHLEADVSQYGVDAPLYDGEQVLLRGARVSCDAAV